MKQKYHIWKNLREKKLIIQEYAVLNTNSRRNELPVLEDEDFSLLCEQAYDVEAVDKSISKGKASVVSLLRNPHFFPIGLYMDKIADSVISMFDSEGECIEDLIFDDKDFIFEILAASAGVSETEIEDEGDIESSEDVNDLFQEDFNIKDSVSSDSSDHEPFDEEKY